MSVIDKRRVAKNSLVLYLRVIVSMIISLWSTRIVLKALGIEDFGIFNVVGGIVVMFSVVSSSLSAAISRFITYELGHGDSQKLRLIFKTAIWIQGVISLIIVVLAETVGLWFLNKEMNIPASQMTAANWVYQFSIVAFVLDLISVPYNALLIAHERMKVFAYVGIFASVAKLIAAWSLLLVNDGRLVMYAAMVMAISLVTRLFYGVYCNRSFSETHGAKGFQRGMFKEIFSFAGWNFIGATAGIFRDQGVNILLNIFFGATVNAARGIAIQVSSAATTFSNNFMTALNPQITKSYASGDVKGAMGLVFTGARMGYFLMLIISMPIIMQAPYILKLWLGEVPEYSVVFVRLVMLVSLIDVVSIPLMTVMLAHGNIRNYQLVVGGCNLLILPLAYVVLWMGFPPQSAIVVTVVMSAVALGLRLLLLHSMVGLSPVGFIKDVVLSVVATSVIALFVPVAFQYMIYQQSLFKCLTVCSVSVLSSMATIYLVGMRQNERQIVNRGLSRIRGLLLQTR